MTGRAKRVGQVIALAAVAGLLVLLVWKLAFGSGGGAASELAKGQHPTAPAFTLSRLDASDGKLSLAELKGKPVVVNFWASWCDPCKQEAKALEQAWRQYRRQGVVFVGIDYHDVTGDARRFLEHHGVTYLSVLDGSGQIGDRYGLTGVPETFFVDRRGRLVGDHILGPITLQKWASAFHQGLQAALDS
jgi:cytochrome c biogenesis protein CcmG/thiol:disulfide interchange protein DsbE